MAELRRCPFCSGEAIMHEGEYASKLAESKKEIPKGARLIRSTTYPSGKTWHEYRAKAYIPRCMDTKCLGRTYRMFETAEEAEVAWNRRAGDSDAVD